VEIKSSAFTNGIRDKPASEISKSVRLPWYGDGTQSTPTVWDGTQGFWDLCLYDRQQPWDKRGKQFQLSHWLRTYDWSRMTVTAISVAGSNNLCFVKQT
jgi:hypothetical protein